MIDALDECDQTRGKLISALCQVINQVTKVKIFISSRRDADITNQVRPIPNISVEATNNREGITSLCDSEHPVTSDRPSATRRNLS